MHHLACTSLLISSSMHQPPGAALISPSMHQPPRLALSSASCIAIFDIIACTVCVPLPCDQGCSMLSTRHAWGAIPLHMPSDLCVLDRCQASDGVRRQILLFWTGVGHQIASGIRCCCPKQMSCIRCYCPGQASGIRCCCPGQVSGSIKQALGTHCHQRAADSKEQSQRCVCGAPVISLHNILHCIGGACHLLAQHSALHLWRLPSPCPTFCFASVAPGSPHTGPCISACCSLPCKGHWPWPSPLCT